MIIVYKLDSHDCDRYFFSDAPASIFCPKCRCVISENYFPNSLKLRSGWDIGCTYDGCLIVSDRFRKICFDLGLDSDLSFFRVDDCTSTFLLYPRRVLPVDVGKGVIWRRSHWCPNCSDFSQITLPDPFRLAQGSQQLKYGARRSDIHVGSLRAKHHITFVGTETKKQLENLKIKSLIFTPVQAFPE